MNEERYDLVIIGSGSTAFAAALRAAALGRDRGAARRRDDGGRSGARSDPRGGDDARFGATLADRIETIHVYPTMAEAPKVGALAFYKDVSKLSCCAE